MKQSNCSISLVFDICDEPRQGNVGGIHLEITRELLAPGHSNKSSWTDYVNKAFIRLSSRCLIVVAAGPSAGLRSVCQSKWVPSVRRGPGRY